MGGEGWWGEHTILRCGVGRGGCVCDVVQPQKHHPGASRETPQETQHRKGEAGGLGYSISEAWFSGHIPLQHLNLPASSLPQYGIRGQGLCPSITQPLLLPPFTWAALSISHESRYQVKDSGSTQDTPALGLLLTLEQPHPSPLQDHRNGPESKRELQKVRVLCTKRPLCQEDIFSASL